MFTFKTSHRSPKAMQDVVAMLAIDKDNLPTFFERAHNQLVEQAKIQRSQDLHVTVPANGSQPTVDLHAYFPNNADPNSLRPTIYFTHGGGYVLGVARQQADMLSEIATRNQVNVVTVEYRLATIAPFPAYLNDAYHGLQYLFENAQQFKADKNKIMLMGDSAGSGLATRLALYKTMCLSLGKSFCILCLIIVQAVRNPCMTIHLQENFRGQNTPINTLGNAQGQTNDNRAGYALFFPCSCQRRKRFTSNFYSSG